METGSYDFQDFEAMHLKDEDREFIKYICDNVDKDDTMDIDAILNGMQTITYNKPAVSPPPPMAQPAYPNQGVGGNPWPHIGSIGSVPTNAEIMEYLKIQSCMITDIYDMLKALQEKLNER